MWEKFGLPSYTGSEYMDEGLLNCSKGLDLSPGAMYRNELLCWDMMNCVLGYAGDVQSAQFSSSATILGLLPTALSMMATSTDDLLRIHSRFPLLAFLMSLCNPSTISTSISSSLTIVRPFQSNRSSNLRLRLTHGMPIPFTKIRIPIQFWQHDVLLHVIACLLVFMIMYQTVVLGIRGVIVYACWTSHNPITWVCVGGIAHLLRILSWRLCLGPIPSPALPDEPKTLALIRPRWHWNLSASAGSHLEIRHPRTARFLAIMFQVIGIMNYGYGTLQLSGFTLVGPTIAIRTSTLIGFSGLISRLIAIWLLEVYPDIPAPVRVDGYGELSEGQEGTDGSIRMNTYG